MTYLILLALLASVGGGAIAQPVEDDPRVRLGLVPAQVLEGSRLFFEETFDGNGRVCGTCHLAEDNLQIELSTIRELPATAPFFAANVPGLEQPNLIRQGLVLENLDGLSQPPVFRSTPHTLSLSTSITSRKDQAPGTDAVGWSGDGAPAPGTLRDFARGAVTQHFTRSLARVPGVDFRLPTPEEEEALLAFQLSLGRVSDIDLAAVRFSDPQAERGRAGPEAFLDSVNNNCQRCHGDASANRGVDGGGPELVAPGIPTGNQNKDTNVDVLRVQFAPHDDGRGTPGDETFSPPPLIEAADTSPFFHIGATFDLESAVRFYTVRGHNDDGRGVFSGQQQTFDEAKTQEIGAMLRSLNAALNAQMAVQRIEAALAVLLVEPDHPSVGELLDLAAEEAEDGVSVLRSPGAAAAKSSLAHCADLARRASLKTKPIHHLHMIEEARVSCAGATGQLGTGLTMQLGAGNLAMRSASFEARERPDRGRP